MYFTYKNRENLSTAVIIFNIIQIIFGVLLIGLGGQTDLVAWKLTSYEKQSVHVVFLTIAALGVLIVINQSLGISIARKALIKAYERSTRKSVNFWLVLGFIIAVDGLIIASVCPFTSGRITKSIRYALSHGLCHYLVDTSWHEMLDRIQQDLYCCGVDSYLDWHKNSWILKKYLNPDSETVNKYIQKDGAIYPPVTPWSCCRVDYEYPCFHDPIQQSHYTKVWAKPECWIDGIYQQGCAAAVSWPIQFTLTTVVVISLLLFAIQIIITILLRLLYTSASNAVKLGDMYGLSPGWIFGNQEGISLEGIGKRKGGKHRKYKRTHDPVADLMLRPGEVLEQDSTPDSDAPLPQPKRSKKRRRYSPKKAAHQLSEMKSKIKMKAHEAKDCMVDRFKKCQIKDKLRNMKNRRRHYNKEEEAGKTDTKVHVMLENKSKELEHEYTTSEDNESTSALLGKPKFSFKRSKKKMKKEKDISSSEDTDFTRVDSPEADKTKSFPIKMPAFKLKQNKNIGTDDENDDFARDKKDNLETEEKPHIYSLNMSRTKTKKLQTTSNNNINNSTKPAKKKSETSMEKILFPSISKSKSSTSKVLSTNDDSASEGYIKASKHKSHLQKNKKSEKESRSPKRKHKK